MCRIMVSFAKWLRRHHKDFFPLDVSASVLDGRLIRHPAKDARRKCEPCLVRVSRRRVCASELLLLSLRRHRIAMVQPAESRKGLNLAFTRRANFCCTTCWRVLRQSKMSPVLMVVEQVGRQQSTSAPTKSKALSAIKEVLVFEISDITIEFASSSDATVRFRKKWDTSLASGKTFRERKSSSSTRKSQRWLEDCF